MSHGTDFTVDVFLNRQTFTNEYELDEVMKESEDTLNSLRQQLMMYAVSNPSDITPKEWDEERVRFIHTEVNTILESYDEELNKLILLELYKETKPFNK